MSLLWFLLLIGLLVTVHELGHLIAARLCDVKVLKVSIGLGPRLASIRRSETEYAIGLVPIGGYVRLLGEDRRDAVSQADRPRAFCFKPAGVRLLVILAGPLANLIFPVLLFSWVQGGQRFALSSTIGAVFAGQPAADADLRVGDRVVAVDDQPVRYWDELNRRITSSPGRELRITVERAGVSRPITRYVRPREHRQLDAFGVPERVGLIGVAPHFRLPQIGVRGHDSAAHRAGLRSFDVILSIQGRPVSTREDLAPLFHPRSGGMLVVTYVRPSPGPGFAAVALLQPATAQIIPSAIERPGRSPSFETGLYPADLFLAEVKSGTPAARLGLARGDLLTHLDGEPVIAWELFARALEEHPTQPHRLAWITFEEGRAIKREGELRLERRRSIDEYRAEATLHVFGAEGARAVAPVPMIPVELRVAQAMGQGVGRAVSATGTLLRVLGRTLLGRTPARTFGGPLLIYEVAGVAAERGGDQFLAMASVLSINLGLLNLLPVPLLDGGQALLVILETVRRRPVSARIVERATFIGVLLLVVLLLFASRNDLLRHFGS